MGTNQVATFSLVEAAALADVETKKVRKDIEQRVFGYRGRNKRLGMDVAVYLRIVSGLSFQLGVDDRRRLYRSVSGALKSPQTPVRIALGDVAEIRIGEVLKALKRRSARFEKWQAKRVLTDESVLGGEPVFDGTRLSVRMIGRMLSDGLVQEVREDHPYLSNQDLEFAELYLRAFPRQGRPREAASR